MALIAFRPFSKMLCYFALSKKYFFHLLGFHTWAKISSHFFDKRFFFRQPSKTFFCMAREENGIKMTACPSSLSAPSFVIQNFHKMLKSVVFHLRGSYFAMLGLIFNACQDLRTNNAINRNFRKDIGGCVTTKYFVAVMLNFLNEGIRNSSIRCK